jgi:predicted RNA polymerase sigma factor
VARWALTDPGPLAVDERRPADEDDALLLLVMCCHPSLSVASQIALTLRAVAGLDVAEIGRSLLTSEETVTRRITRAKRSIQDSGVPFPPSRLDDERLDAVLRVLYLIFTEGYASTRGGDLQRVDLAEEAIRLTRQLRGALPDHSETAGLLALMLLVHARHRARVGADGSLIPMAAQDRGLWDRAAIGEGIELITATLPHGSTGPYQLQAAIAAVHDEAQTAEATDWRQIVALYEVLLGLDDNPVIALNHAVAVSMVDGPAAGLALLDGLRSDPRVDTDRRLHAVRGHLLEQGGDVAAAADAFRSARSCATNVAQQRYLNEQIARLEHVERSDQAE